MPAAARAPAGLEGRGRQGRGRGRGRVRPAFRSRPARRGRRLIGWDEILEGGLAPGATVMSWRGEQGGIAAATAGHDVVMAPQKPTYLDHSQTQLPTEPAGRRGRNPPPRGGDGDRGGA